jgi:hypothetical protein
MQELLLEDFLVQRLIQEITDKYLRSNINWSRKQKSVLPKAVLTMHRATKYRGTVKQPIEGEINWEENCSTFIFCCCSFREKRFCVPKKTSENYGDFSVLDSTREKTSPIFSPSLHLKDKWALQVSWPILLLRETEESASDLAWELLQAMMRATKATRSHFLRQILVMQFDARIVVLNVHSFRRPP